MKPDGSYSRVLGITVPPKKHDKSPVSVPPAGHFTIRGANWKATIPIAILAAIVSAFGARALPTPTSEDRTLTRLEMQPQVRELRDEQFRSEIRSELAALREQSARGSQDLHNRISIIEAALKREARP